VCVCGLLACVPLHCPARYAGDWLAKPANLPDESVLAPYQGSSIETIDYALSLAGADEATKLLDIGCGDGRILARAVTKFNVREAHGFEMSHDVYLLAKAHLEAVAASQGQAGRVASSVCLTHGDALSLCTDEALAAFDIIVLFLLPSGLESLRPLLERRLLSNANNNTASLEKKTRNKKHTLVCTLGWQIGGGADNDEWKKRLWKKSNAPNGGCDIFIYRFITSE